MEPSIGQPRVYDPFIAKRTLYNNVWYRSRLEAKWAMIMDRLGWRVTYESVDLYLYMPDFVLSGLNQVLLVEVKPIHEYDPRLREKAIQGLRCTPGLVAMYPQPSELLVLGAELPWATTPEIGYPLANHCVGWLVNLDPNDQAPVVYPAVICAVSGCRSAGLVPLGAKDGWKDRISGNDVRMWMDEEPYLRGYIRLTEAWAAAGNLVQYLPEEEKWATQQRARKRIDSIAEQSWTVVSGPLLAFDLSMVDFSDETNKRENT